MSKEITFEFATRDDCLDQMVPSDLRVLVAQRDRLEQQLAEVREVVQASLDVVDACAGHDWHRCEQHNLLDKISALSDALKEKNNEMQ